MTPKTSAEIAAMTPEERAAYDRELTKSIGKFFLTIFVWKLVGFGLTHLLIKLLTRKLQDD